MYRELVKTQEKVFPLGLGCMRFPTIGQGENQRIDREKTINLIRYAIDNGVNYIDTGWFYHNGESETVVGLALQDGYREKVLLAAKTPLELLNSPNDHDEIFAKQFEKMQTEYFDFYLMHSTTGKSWRTKVLGYGLLDKVEKAKEEGKIRHIGFSFHDDFDAFRKIVDGYDGWEFCQIQLNYADVNYQAGLKGLEYAAQKGLDVIIMEPLRGGKLAIPPKRVEEILDKGKSPVEWGLDFLWNKEEVGVVLSGMSNMEQLTANLEYAKRSFVGMLNDRQNENLIKAGEIFNKSSMVGCTGCGYCMPCQGGLNIPDIFKVYNRFGRGDKRGAKEEYSALSKKATDCLECKKCEKHCPQQIEISSVMNEIAENIKL